jgi:hypothetical protein
VAIEDLHWAEPSLLEMLERIHRRSRGPLLRLATARPELVEAHPAWSRRSGMSQLFQEPLAERDARALVDHLLPAAGDELRARVAELAEGNPFFTEELVRHVASEGEPECPTPCARSWRRGSTRSRPPRRARSSTPRWWAAASGLPRWSRTGPARRWAPCCARSRTGG